MRTDGSFHGSFTLAPLPAAWFLMRHRRNGSPLFRMRSETASVQIGEICGRQISAQCAKEQAECIYSPTDRTRRFSQKPCGVPLSKKHGLHRCARMGLFTDSLLLLRCPLLGFDAQSAQRIATDFSHAESCVGECHTMGLLGMRKICGNPRNLWATTKRTMR